MNIVIFNNEEDIIAYLFNYQIVIIYTLSKFYNTANNDWYRYQMEWVTWNG